MSDKKRYRLTDIPDRDIPPSTEEVLKKLKENGLDVEYGDLKAAKECYDLSTKALYLSIGALIISFVAGVIALIKLYS